MKQTKQCIVCTVSFEKPYTCGNPEWGKRKFCSRVCKHQWQREHPPAWLPSRKGCRPPNAFLPGNGKKEPVTIQCLECRSFFLVKHARRNVAKFCCHKCSTDHRNVGATPANTAARKTEAYNAWRTLVFERDDYTCVECGQRGGKLHADHIKPFAFFPELSHDVTNGRTLCVPCHIKTPTYGGRTTRLKREMAASQHNITAP